MRIVKTNDHFYSKFSGHTIDTIDIHNYKFFSIKHSVCKRRWNMIRSISFITLLVIILVKYVDVVITPLKDFKLQCKLPFSIILMTSDKKVR